MVDSYIDFARFYDSLMEDARYPERADYLLEICACFSHPVGDCLDLACGTGSLTGELYRRGVNVTGADISADMLTVAADRFPEIRFVCQPMQALELPVLVDTVVCTLDSVNHLTEDEDVQETFCRVAQALNPGGLFVFDVNTLYKHREILGDNAYTIENETVFCAWQNVLCEDNATVEILLDFFEEQEDGSYRRYSEQFCEKAYSGEQLRQMLASAGLETLAVYGDLTFEEPADDEQRAVYVARKPLKGN